MKFKLPADLKALDRAALDALKAEALAEAQDIASVEADELTKVQLDELDALGEAMESIDAQIAETDDLSARAEAAKARFAKTEEAPADEVEGDEVDVDAEDKVEEKEAITAAARRRGGVALASGAKPEEQEPPAKQLRAGYLTASVDVPGVPAGKELADIGELAKAFEARSRSFKNRYNSGPNAAFERYSVATIQKPEREFKVHAGMSIDEQLETIKAASSERRLAGGSLVAALGWCAPSETSYEFCDMSEVTGTLDLPSVTITHGGINFTRGPQLSELLSSANFGFLFTETQLEAGTTKPCFDITCPPFTDERLDVAGWCLRSDIPVASPAGWPALLRQFLDLAVKAHAIRMDVDTIARVSTAIGAATNYVELGSAVADILDGISLQAIQLRRKLFLAANATIEVLLPTWFRDVVRADLARRNGDLAYLLISDAQIDSMLRVRNLAPQFLTNYQPIPTTGAAPTPGTAFPSTLEAMLYPAGTFVKGENDVISLDTVYDAASLSTNKFTAAFFEEATMVYSPCGEGRKVTIDISCLKGVVGAAELTCIVTP